MATGRLWRGRGDPAFFGKGLLFFAIDRVVKSNLWADHAPIVQLTLKSKFFVFSGKEVLPPFATLATT